MTPISAQPDLFGEACIPGLAQADAIVTPDEERALTAAIDAADLSPFRFHGWLGRRLTTSYGWGYDFDDGLAPAGPIPDWLLPLREKAARFAQLDSGGFVQALLIRYDPGAGIGWHRDRPVYEHVLGISLGATATMRFRRRKPGGFDRATAELAPRSIYHLTGEARHQWEHSIAPMPVTRWSITFRTLSEKGRLHAQRTSDPIGQHADLTRPTWEGGRGGFPSALPLAAAEMAACRLFNPPIVCGSELPSWR